MEQTVYAEKETLEINEYQKRFDDISTWAAEALDGNMRSEFSFQFDGQDLYGRDGRTLTPIFDNAIENAKNNAKFEPLLNFEVERRIVERQELDDILAMARGDGPNTMVVVSDFPMALKEHHQNVGGYDTKRQQTMLRVISREQDGSIKMTSQSLDRSDRQSLEAIYDSFDLVPEQGELLGQRIQLDLPSSEQQVLVDKLTGIYDRSLNQKFGGSWYAGRANNAIANTYDFVLEQQDLLNAFTERYLDGELLSADQFYNLAAAIQNRVETRQHVSSHASRLVMPTNPIVEMELAGNQARKEGRSFSGCGLTVGADGASETDQELNELGYGDKGDKKTMKCVNCPECGTFHDEVKKVAGKYRCKNKTCKLH